MLELGSVFFGALFTLGSAYAAGRLALGTLRVPRTIVFATGSALLSLLVFLLLLAGAANRLAFSVLGSALILLWCFCRRKLAQEPPGAYGEPRALWVFAPILTGYGVFYLVNAMAPEVQPDAITYHLGLAAGYLRGAFNRQVGFYQLLPQGLEMLFAFAFAFGRHSAAKLVHFAFLAATFPMMLAVGRRLGLSYTTSAAAAAFYLISPVVGITGTSAYNDAALVFFLLAAFYMVWAWKQEGDDRLLLVAGLLAGFCYAVKMTGLVAFLMAALFVLSQRRWKASLYLVAGAALMIGPWMLRSALLTGNPVAPFFNRLFPNPYFHIATENKLLNSLRTYEGFTLVGAPLELTVRGRLLQGLLGPLFLLAPAGLLALRRPSARVAGVIAIVMAAPWVLNAGTRFLMPSLPWVALLLAMALPKPLAFSCVLLHAVTCLPPVAGRYAEPGAWRLQGFPWRAALRLESGKDYLRRSLPEYRLAELVQKHTYPKARILDLAGAPSAYISRELIGTWQSALGDRLSEALAAAAYQERGEVRVLPVVWPEQSLDALRIRRLDGPPGRWMIQEVALKRGSETVRNSSRWSLRAWPNVWEAALAFDGNIVSGWDTWEPAKPGMYLEVDFGPPPVLTGAELICFRPADDTRLEFLGRGPDGAWRRLGLSALVRPYPEVSLRKAAVRLIRRERIRYILARGGKEGHGVTATELGKAPGDWGVRLVARWENVSLYFIE